MKRNPIRTAVLASLLAGLSTSTVLADPPETGSEKGPRDRGARREGGPGRGGPGGGGGPEGFGRMIQMLPIYKALDVDQDGTISSDEINNAVAALKTLDKDNDGSLSANELRPTMMGNRGGGPGGPGGPGGREGMSRQGRGGPEMVAKMFENRDADGDGKLSGDEIPEAMSGRLARIDADGDGSLSKEELTKAMSRMGGGGQGRRGDRNGDGGGEPGGDRPKRPATE
ncbi:transaldolase/EF-hand domain-containing protein [Rubripirellula amarantea]|uniref:Transaldolase/EF-hand domain-containing protein n=1 Tax=Rubripirellula amarantea TaxID=2527999 RepID=A0A5C5WKB5_9BACT|nr:EF-hand domain-containing protein [Rubripirellula amarantea]TWT50302.1 transaldolase/EF-hand domain-containing protein [Rubripirellula amarantea]